MSIKKVFTVYDSKAEAYLPPFCSPTRGVAIRMVRAACLDVNHDFHKFGADYTLFEIAEFDERTGCVEMYDSHYNLGTGLAIGQLEEV